MSAIEIQIESPRNLQLDRDATLSHPIDPKLDCS